VSAGSLLCGSPDAPPVMLIHGLGSSYRVWDRVVPLIQPAARIYAVELDATGSIDSDADAVAALLDRPMLLVGHSRGGLVATAVAERHRELVSKLILVCPSWSVSSRLSANRPTERALCVPLIGDLLWALASPRRQRRAMQNAFAPGTSVPDQFVADMRARGRRSLTDSSRAIDDYLKAARLADRLEKLAVPTELIFGRHDARVAAPRDEFSALCNTSLVVLPGIGHSPPWEAPGAVAEIIAHSLASQSHTRDPGSTVIAAQRRKESG
jgi:pimeloyl-ACP methyl ester carboxylesterase